MELTVPLHIVLFILCFMMMWSLSVFGCQADSAPAEHAHFRACPPLLTWEPLQIWTIYTTQPH